MNISYESESICPKCGLIGRRKIEKRGRRLYVLYTHYGVENRVRDRCYVGPASEYEYIVYYLTTGTKEIKLTGYLEIAYLAIKKYVENYQEKIKQITNAVNEVREMFPEKERERIDSASKEIEEIARKFIRNEIILKLNEFLEKTKKLVEELEKS